MATISYSKMNFSTVLDVVSIKITALVSAPCFIIPFISNDLSAIMTDAMVWLGAISVVSNITYNTIRIIKELKSKKDGEKNKDVA
jgi:hypothetical protein